MNPERSYAVAWTFTSENSDDTAVLCGSPWTYTLTSQVPISVNTPPVNGLYPYWIELFCIQQVIEEGSDVSGQFVAGNDMLCHIGS